MPSREVDPPPLTLHVVKLRGGFLAHRQLYEEGQGGQSKVVVYADPTRWEPSFGGGLRSLATSAVRLQTGPQGSVRARV
jgi:hypothetical protein